MQEVSYLKRKVDAAPVKVVVKKRTRTEQSQVLYPPKTPPVP